MIDFGATGVDSWAELLLMFGGGILSILLTILLTLANRWIKAKTDITIFQNEEQMRMYLSDAIFNGFQTVIKNNDFEKVKQDKDGTAKAIQEYLKQTTPEVLKKLKVNPDSDALKKAIDARVESIIERIDKEKSNKVL